MSKKKRGNKKQEKSMIWTIIPIAVSGIALIVSICMAFLQYHYAQAEYEYKRNPTFKPSLNGLGLQLENRNGTIVANPVVDGFSIDIEAVNNLDRLYIIAPDFSVSQIQSRETMETDISEELIEENVGKYFKRAYADGQPDMKFGDFWYFYRFFVFVNLENEYNIQTFCYKATPALGAEETLSTFFPLTEVDFLEYEKAHLDDEKYAGEREIAAQYREIKEYLAGMAIK